MITKDKMMKPMLVACPEFQADWADFVDEWKDEDEPPIELALRDLGRHLIALLAAGRTAQLRRIFEVVERWVSEGDDPVRETVMAGLMETLQDQALHHHTKPAQLEPLLLGESRRLWAEVVPRGHATAQHA